MCKQPHATVRELSRAAESVKANPGSEPRQDCSRVSAPIFCYFASERQSNVEITDNIEYAHTMVRGREGQLSGRDHGRLP